MRKVNLWNRLFHFKELSNQFREFKSFGIIIDTYPSLLNRLNDAKSLHDLLSIHKQAWGFGYQNGNLGPCGLGMFRCTDIIQMKPEDVFLGDVYGLYTFSIPDWEKKKDLTMEGNAFGLEPDVRCYDVVMGRYKKILQSNIKSIFFKTIQRESEYIVNKWVLLKR